MTPRRSSRTTARKSAPKRRRTTAKRSSTADSAVEAQLEAIERDGGDGDVVLGRGVQLRVSSLGKVYFPDAGVTKGALMRYYVHVAPVLLPQLEGRPLVLKRYP